VLGALAAAALACGETPQRPDEAAISYRVGFTAESGVVTRVIFPWIADATAAGAQTGIAVTDGGSAKVETTTDGAGLAVEGKGHVEASYSARRLPGLGNERGIPEALLTREVPDGGLGERYVQVNKGGAASAQIQFEYSASRDCGSGCGGTRSWKYTGPVGLSRQVVSMEFTEAKAR
jgi:hypothetical protein